LRPTLVIEPSGFFAARTPLLPLAALTADRGTLQAPQAFAAGSDLDAAVAADRARLTDQVRAHLANPAIREALFIASPSLDRAIDAWLVSPSDARAHGVVDVVARYLARMAARPTPFGLFSGCSVGTIDARTRLELAPRAGYRRHTRLDVHYLSALCDALGRDPALRARAPLKPSDGILETATQLRYPEASTDPQTRERSYGLISVERTAHLDAALSLARTGDGATLTQIAEVVAEQAGTTVSEAAAFVDDLVDTQILVSDLAPVVTGPEPLDDLVATLRALDAPATATLESVRDALRVLDASGVGASPSAYRAIAESVASLPTEADIARLFQVDLYKPIVDLTLGKNVVRELTRAAELLARITPCEESEPLRRFREAFQSRYEGREVPLLEALDEETGIGFISGSAMTGEPSPLLDKLRFPLDDASRPVDFGARERLFLRRIEDARIHGALEWSLDAGDLEGLQTKVDVPLPATFAMRGLVAAASSDAVDRGDFRVCIHGVLPSGVQLFGRFCHGDADLRAHVERHLRAEEATRPDAVFAEIVHLPEGRMGNLLCRPVLREYEITYLGRSGAGCDRQIPASDLRVSLAGGRIVLRSSRLGREVLPRLTAAHNASIAALGVYRFLRALTSQGDQLVSWKWGALAGAPFLPRVTHGRAILCLAQWRVTADEVEGLAKLSSADRFRRAQALRAKHRLPRWIALVEGDNVLPLDLDDTLHVDLLSSLTKGHDVVHLTEAFPGEHDLFTSGPEGRFVHELVVPFARVPDPAPTMLSAPSASAASRVTRRFTPGTEWLYAKLYAGTAAADSVLTSVVAPLVERARREGLAERWFFIRYGDPDWHVRVRLHGDSARLTRDALPILHELAQPLIDEGRIWRIQLDTYEREVERFGGDAGIELAEGIFEADSDAVLEILSQLEPGEGGDARWRLAFRGIHSLLLALGLDVSARARVVRAMRVAYAAEHHADAALESDLGARFRTVRPELEDLLQAATGSAHPLDPGFVALDQRAQRIGTLAATLRDRASSGAVPHSIEQLAPAFVHMHANRMLRSEQRSQELVLCDWLARIYESEIARATKRAR
jgi:thiopeptide-type bacteriocin biosynthesis protein